MKNSVVFGLQIIAAITWMHVIATLALCVYIGSLGRGVEWQRRVLLPFSSRIFLRIFGVRVRVEGALPRPAGPVVWISNHRSTLDIFIILSLGLPRTRYSLSDFLQKIPAFLVLGRILGSFWTPGQSFATKRVRLFQKAAAALRRSGDSVFLTPEGERIDSPLVGKFNKGAFHLAMDLQRPVLGIFVHTPDEVSPGLGWRARSGTIGVSFLEVLESPPFSEEGLSRFVQEVREIYLVRGRGLLGSREKVGRYRGMVSDGCLG